MGALVNGVFLIALCLSIFLEAIQRFVQPKEVSHPQIVLIVGCCGLASNILGLLLFHEHGHGHGHSHSHGHGHDNRITSTTQDDGLNAAESGQYVRKASKVKGYMQASQDDGEDDVSADQEYGSDRPNPKNDTITIPPYANIIDRSENAIKSSKRQKREASVSKGHHSQPKSRPYSTIEDIHVHPASLRNDIISAARFEETDSDTDSDTGPEQPSGDSPQPSPKADSPLMGHGSSNFSKSSKRRKSSLANKPWHNDHAHEKPDLGRSGHHNHGDLNMRGVFLHVLGDALGNVGVILSALVIWLTSFSWRFYADPLISLIITLIILASAIPLCKAASRILLQAVPAGIDVNDIKADIEQLPGVLSAHHLHVWQLSDTKLVASIHVQLVFDFKGEGSARYMQLAREVRKCLHGYGIHSSTIQPEFCLDETHDHTTAAGDDNSLHAGSSSGRRTISKQASKANSLREDACLLECEAECGLAQQCCAPTAATAVHDSDDDVETRI